MMKALNWTQAVVVFLMIGLTFFSCKEDDVVPMDDPAEETATAPNPEVGPGDGAFWGINSITTVSQPVIGDLDTKIGTAVAILTNDNFSTFMDAGTVTVTGKDLTKADNNSYTFIPGLTEPLGLEYGTSYDWSIGGKGAVAAFDHTVNFAFPTLGKISSAATVSKSSGYTLTCENVAGADSILYIVAGVVKTVAPDVTSVEFTASDLSGVATGPSFVQIAPYIVKQETIGAKTYYFGNETVRSLVVEVQ